MRQSQVIISITETSCGALDAHQVHSFAAPAEALRYIEGKLQEDLALARKSIPSLDVIKTGGNPRDMWSRKEGTFSYEIGTHGYSVAFLCLAAQYNVSDDEVFSTLDAYCNSNRSHADYKRFAQRIADNMHRYVQGELWKFVKHLVRAFACARYDERNKTAHEQAADVSFYMEAQNI